MCKPIVNYFTTVECRFQTAIFQLHFELVFLMENRDRTKREARNGRAGYSLH